jgi:hypothetical protein
VLQREDEHVEESAEYAGSFHTTWPVPGGSASQHSHDQHHAVSIHFPSKANGRQAHVESQTVKILSGLGHNLHYIQYIKNALSNI